jgi:hypothetical protein
MWFLPSRGRPDNIKRFIVAYKDTAATTPIILWLDEDDAENYADIELPENWIKLVMPRFGGTGIMTNKFYDLYPNEKWYGLLGDDVLPKTQNWDVKLVAAAGLDGLAYGNDLISGEKHAAHPVVGCALVKKLGWLALPGCQRIYIDDALMYAAKLEGKCTYLPEVILEHLHFSVEKSKFDAVYKKEHNDSDKKIFDTWVASYKKPVTFVCVNWGNYCGKGADYVNILFDSVCRNLAYGVTGRFVCFTDSPEGYAQGIETRELPKGVFGWWNKLYLFKAGLFSFGERIIFLDLDTVIVSEMDSIISYDGEFATLRDFYFPERYAPAIIAWKAGACTDIWESYEAAGKPTDLPLGDLSWINQLFSKTGYKPDILQDLYPNKICSYKKDAKFTFGKDVSIVCFHGEPRPHEAGGWVDNVWKVGGSSIGLGNFHCNVSDAILEKNIIHNIKNYSLHIIRKARQKTDFTAIIVGGAPSIQEHLNIIKLMADSPRTVLFGLNNVPKYLYDNKILVNAGILVDAREQNIEFYENIGAFELSRLPFNMLVASWVSPIILEKIKKFNMFHMASDLNMRIAKDGGLFIGGGRTVGLVGLALIVALGYRNIHIFGYDSSFTDGEHHAYSQASNDKDPVIDVTYQDRTFKTTPWMAKQAEDFIELSQALMKENVTLTVHGDGLLPYIAQCISIQPE